MTGTDITKQWLHSSHADRITKLGMTSLGSESAVIANQMFIMQESHYFPVFRASSHRSFCCDTYADLRKERHVTCRGKAACVPLHGITKITLLVFARAASVMAECLQTFPFFSYAP